MKYKIVLLEEKTTKHNKPYKSMTLHDENGNVHSLVNIWSDFPSFETYEIGSEIEGEMTGKRNFKSLSHI